MPDEDDGLGLAVAFVDGQAGEFLPGLENARIERLAGGDTVAEGETLDVGTIVWPGELVATTGVDVDAMSGVAGTRRSSWGSSGKKQQTIGLSLFPKSKPNRVVNPGRIVTVWVPAGNGEV